MPSYTPVDVTLLMSKFAVGAHLIGNEFSYGIFEQDGTEKYTAQNDANGLITFSNVNFTDVGVFEYTVKETLAPPEWEKDDTEWRVTIEVVAASATELRAIVTYPDGTPVFTSKHLESVCGKFEFPELSYDEAGTYEYTLKELTASGGGWQTDKSVKNVTVTVVDDGHGHLIATVHYPEGYPSFVNTYAPCPAKVILHGCKTAVGAPLPAGRFEFGLYDDEDKLISTAKNEALPQV